MFGISNTSPSIGNIVADPDEPNSPMDSPVKFRQHSCAFPPSCSCNARRRCKHMSSTIKQGKSGLGALVTQRAEKTRQLIPSAMFIYLWPSLSATWVQSIAIFVITVTKIVSDTVFSARQPYIPAAAASSFNKGESQAVLIGGKWPTFASFARGGPRRTCPSPF